MTSPTIYQILAIKVALRAYAKHKMQVNRAYTPKNMLAMAEKLTGKKFKRGEYLKAADAFEALADKTHKEEQIKAAVSRTLGEDFGGVL